MSKNSGDIKNPFVILQTKQNGTQFIFRGAVSGRFLWSGNLKRECAPVIEISVRDQMPMKHPDCCGDCYGCARCEILAKPFDEVRHVAKVKLLPVLDRIVKDILREIVDSSLVPFLCCSSYAACDFRKLYMLQVGPNSMIYRKLEVNSRAEALFEASSQGLLSQT